MLRQDLPARFGATARYALFVGVAGVLLLGATRQSADCPTRPGRADEVVAQVPARTDPAERELEQLQTKVARAPRDLTSALSLAQRYIERSRLDGDPRYLGAAEAALASWTAEADPAAEVRLLRATILQSRHEFELALVDLDRVLAVQPEDAQALLTRASVLTVQGKYAAARADCEQLEPLVPLSYAASCLAPVDMITGRAAAAQLLLDGALSSTRVPAERGLLLSVLGEQAYWLDEPARSEQALRAALAIDPNDRYTRTVYADLLLDAGRLAEARTLIGEHSDDALALRLALADLREQRGDSAQVSRVAQNFEASRLRGDAVHRREEARFWLARGDAKRALQSARESWAVQHEPWDARLVLEAALAAERPEQAAAVLAWLHSTGFAAPRLRALARSLEEKS